MKPSQELELTAQPKTLAVQEPEAPALGTIMSLIERASKDPSVDIDKMERLMAMAERMQAGAAVQAFNAAFSKMQSEIPVIVAETVIPNRGKYARFENVMNQIQEHLTANGFSVSFEQSAPDDKRIKVACHLRHIKGHSQQTSFTVRLGGKADSDTQSDCKASTTAKRNALLQALNIVVRQDCLQDEDDPHNEPEMAGFITEKEADELRDWLEAVDGDREEFLKYAKADTFFTIQASMLPRLHETLRRKEAANKK